MRRLGPGQISDYFNAQKEKFAAAHAQDGLLEGLQDLSLAVSDMKAAGIDVSLEIFGDASELAFAMFEGPGMIAPVSGLLRIGNIHRLIAFMTQANDAPCLKLALSKFDIRFNGADGTLKDNKIDNQVRATVYDLKNDPEALVKFQQEIIRFDARNVVVYEQDKADMFDKGQGLRKRPLRITPKNQ
jgi:hypothetical protein